jgi:8-oxo-dGTP pyrophosphatase MutT (NUDIX family)
MYKVFINEISISFLSEEENTTNYAPYQRLPTFIDSSIKVEKFIFFIEKLDFNNFYVQSMDIESEWSAFQALFNCIVSCGGLVFNPKREVLFIKRAGRWELPKGHRESGESLEETAAREVQEECGSIKLEIKRFLLETYHCYLFRNVWCLKQNYWFEMEAEENYVLVPQIEEGITDVAFFDKNRISLIRDHTFKNVLAVLEQSGIPTH